MEGGGLAGWAGQTALRQLLRLKDWDTLRDSNSEPSEVHLLQREMVVGAAKKEPPRRKELKPNWTLLSGWAPTPLLAHPWSLASATPRHPQTALAEYLDHSQHSPVAEDNDCDTAQLFP